jgi:prevent-host-death family protein
MTIVVTRRPSASPSKANLSRYLERVRHGQEVVVTERGVPVAKIVPLVAAERAESRREQLARTGLLQLGSGRVRPSLLKPPKGPTKLGAGVLKALLEEREEGR